MGLRRGGKGCPSASWGVLGKKTTKKNGGSERKAQHRRRGGKVCRVFVGRKRPRFGTLGGVSFVIKTREVVNKNLGEREGG